MYEGSWCDLSGLILWSAEESMARAERDEALHGTLCSPIAFASLVDGRVGACQA